MSIVRLHDPETGKFYCSGTVISEKYVLTAAHCVLRPIGFFEMAKVDSVDVRSEDGKVSIMAIVAGANGRADVALLQGDFSKFRKAAIEIDPAKLQVKPGHNYISCGFPYAGKLYCTRLEAIGVYGFQIATTGQLFPGMSGGPVIDAETGVIIAVNTGMTDTAVIVSPLIELFDNLDVKP